MSLVVGLSRYWLVSYRRASTFPTSPEPGKSFELDLSQFGTCYENYCINIYIQWIIPINQDSISTNRVILPMYNIQRENLVLKNSLCTFYFIRSWKEFVKLLLLIEEVLIKSHNFFFPECLTGRVGLVTAALTSGTVRVAPSAYPARPGDTFYSTF